MRTKLSLLLAAVFLVLTLGSGCVVVVEEECFSNVDCLGDTVCVSGFCAQACDSDFDCSFQDICVGGACLAPSSGCTSDLQCDMGDFCAGDGFCYPYADWAYECAFDGDCPGEGECVGGVCSPKYACTSDLDCFDIADYCNPYGWCAIE